MRITNRYGFPDAIVRAVSNDPYSKGDSDYSVSDLITPPRILALKKKHWDDLEEDASDLVWSLYGQAVHHIGEVANIHDVAERRLYWEVDGKIISGQMDNYSLKNETLSDYKTATVAKFTFSDFKDWEEQQNCYAQLLRWHGDPIKRLEIVAFVRDHRPKEAELAKTKGKYYPEKALIKELPLWPETQAIAFIKNRIAIHEKAKTELPLCTPSERWAKADIWAVRRVGLKDAVRGHADHGSEESAKKAVEALGKGHYVEHRPAKNTRCERYCTANKFCSQFKDLSR